MHHERRLLHLGPRVPLRAPASPRLPGRAVLRGLLARLHLGRAPRRQRAAGHGDADRVRQGASNPVDLEITPAGDILYANLDGGTIQRIRSTANAAPTARVTANPTSGAAPLTVAFSGTGSSDPNGDTLAYAWDLDDDGQFDDSTAASPSFTYTTAGMRTVRLRVSDPGGLSGTDQVTITVGHAADRHDRHADGRHHMEVGETISFSGSADVHRRGAAGSTLRWRLDLEHCESGGGCHTHQVQTFDGARERQLHRARPRVPVASDAAPDRDRRRRAVDDRLAPARPAHGAAHLRDPARRTRAVGRQPAVDGAVHPRSDRRLVELRDGAQPADPRRTRPTLSRAGPTAARARTRSRRRRRATTYRATYAEQAIRPGSRGRVVLRRCHGRYGDRRVGPGQPRHRVWRDPHRPRVATAAR